MALVVGTNCGFVTAAPTLDPEGATGVSADYTRRATRFQSTQDGTISQIGIYVNNATQAANIVLGIYEDVAGEPGVQLETCVAFAKGTTAGWKTDATFSTPVTNGTYYWLAYAMTNTATETGVDATATAGTGRYQGSVTTLQNPWNTGTDTNSTYLVAIYALYYSEAPPPILKVNIGDVWKDVSAIQINIGDTWKAVTKAEVNIGDVWKTIFSA
jgi:hypothetical protein